MRLQLQPLRYHWAMDARVTAHVLYAREWTPDEHDYWLQMESTWEIMRQLYPGTTWN